MIHWAINTYENPRFGTEISSLVVAPIFIAVLCTVSWIMSMLHKKKTNPADRGLLGTSVIVAISIINTRIRHTLVPSPTCPCGILKVPCLQQVSCIRNIAFCWDSMILHWPRWMLEQVMGRRPTPCVRNLRHTTAMDHPLFDAGHLNRLLIRIKSIQFNSTTKQRQQGVTWSYPKNHEDSSLKSHLSGLARNIRPWLKPWPSH